MRRQGKAVADNIAASLLRKPVKDFRFRTLGLLVALGHRTAAAELRGWRFSGLLAWFMWRAIYWSKETPDLSPIPLSGAAKFSIALCIAGMFWLGIFPDTVLNLATEAASALKF